jgi:hypothetical protein
MGDKTFGFFNLYETKSDCYIGSLLVTSDSGLPMEYKCTQPISISEIQKVLYGEQLVQYIGVNLCLTSILENLKHKPKLLFVIIPDFITSEVPINITTVLINKEAQITKESLELVNSEGKYPPLLISVNNHQQTEFKEKLPIINDLFNRFNLVEPFERMRVSVEILVKTDSKFK